MYHDSTQRKPLVNFKEVKENSFIFIKKNALPTDICREIIRRFENDKENTSYHIMATENNTVIGIARLEFPQESAAQLRYMAIDNSKQNKDIGKKIISHMEQYAKKQSANEIFLHARENTVGFYEKLGYWVTEKSYLLFDSIQHYKMHKSL